VADILSLSKARKTKAKAAREAAAAENRTRFGRTKAEKAADKAEAARKDKQIDAHRRDR
jgi:hypothetical protein